MLGAMFYAGMSSYGEMEADCDLGEITYGIEKGECWNNEILPENCPLPKKLHCKVRIKMSSYELAEFLLNID